MPITLMVSKRERITLMVSKTGAHRADGEQLRRIAQCVSRPVEDGGADEIIACSFCSFYDAVWLL